MEPTTADPIARVCVLSTGSVSIRPEHVGPTRKNTYVWLLTSKRWTAPRPVNVYVVEHHAGLVLFDTGQDRASVTNPGYVRGRFNRFLYSRLARFEIGPHETLAGGLSALGYRLGEVTTAVLSHLHQDHIGGLPELGHASIAVSSDEWASLAAPFPSARGLLRTRIDLPGLRWDSIVPEPLADPTLAPFSRGHDLFGDGSLLVLPTPGHTPGSQSMLVRRPGHPPLLMVGDLAYDAGHLATGTLPGVGSPRRMRQTFAAVNALRRTMPDLVVLPAHDPGAARRLAVASTRAGDAL